MTARTPLHDQTSSNGAVYVEEADFLVPAHFGDALAEYRAARESAVLIDQSASGKIEARGTDAARFLHNLTTNDILGLPPGSGCEAFLTTAKAKVIAYLLIFRHIEPDNSARFELDVTPSKAETVIQHLDRYLISEQVAFANLTAAFSQMHLAGPRASVVLEQVLGDANLPVSALQHKEAQLGNTIKCWLRRHDALGLPGYDLICLSEHAVSIWKSLLQAGASPAGREACEVLRIEAGLPREGADIDETTFAPEVGRIAETICYTKGCYLGQESIVMARDRGQVNRTLVGVQLPSGPVPHGSRLLAGDAEAGRVTSSVTSPRLGMGVGLAYVRRGHQQPGTKLEVEDGGERKQAQVVKLPL